MKLDQQAKKSQSNPQMNFILTIRYKGYLCKGFMKVEFMRTVLDRKAKLMISNELYYKIKRRKRIKRRKIKKARVHRNQDLKKSTTNSSPQLVVNSSVLLLESSIDLGNQLRRAV